MSVMRNMVSMLDAAQPALTYARTLRESKKGLTRMQPLIWTVEILMTRAVILSVLLVAELHLMKAGPEMTVRNTHI